jgi:hypothetical protein
MQPFEGRQLELWKEIVPGICSRSRAASFALAGSATALGDRRGLPQAQRGAQPRIAGHPPQSSDHLLMLEKRDRAPKRFSHHIGVMNVTHPSSTDIPDLLQCLVSLPIRAKQLKRQKEPLFTTLLRRFHIVLVYGFLQFQKRE